MPLISSNISKFFQYTRFSFKTYEEAKRRRKEQLNFFCHLPAYYFGGKNLYFIFFYKKYIWISPLFLYESMVSKLKYQIYKLNLTLTFCMIIVYCLIFYVLLVIVWQNMFLEWTINFEWWKISHHIFMMNSLNLFNKNWFSKKIKNNNKDHSFLTYISTLVIYGAFLFQTMFLLIVLSFF